MKGRLSPLTIHYALSFLLGLLVGIFLALPLQAQLLTVAQADSLKSFKLARKADTNQVGALLGLSRHYQGRTLNYRHNLDSALMLANQAHTVSQQLHDEKGQQEALFQQGRVLIKQEKLGTVKSMLSSVSPITRIRLLLELGKNRLRPTYSQEANLDTALWYFGQADRLSNRIGSQPWQQESQLLMGVAYLFKGDCKTGKAWFRRVIDAHRRAGDQAGELRTWLRWSTIKNCEWICLDDSTEITKTLTLARQLGDKPTEVMLLLNRAMDVVRRGEFKQAEQIALQALGLQKAISYKRYNQAFHTLEKQNDYLEPQFLFNLLDTRCLLIDLYYEINNLSKGVFHNLELIKDMERSGLQEDLDWPYFWLGNTYYHQEQYAKSLAYYQQSLAVSQRKYQGAVHVGLIRRMAEMLIREGKARQALKVMANFSNQHQPIDYSKKTSIAIGFGQCYEALGNYTLAERSYLEAVTWDRKNREILLPYIHISRFYVATAQYGKATPYIQRLLADTLPFHTPPNQMLQLYLLHFKVDSAQANYPSALRYYQRYTALKDVLFNEKTNTQIAELDIKYQTRQKEQALLLRQKDISLLTQQNHAQQTQRNALIGGTFLLAALLGISYNRYRLNQQSNQRLQEQQEQINQKNQALQRLLEEKERLLKEIHHRVKNNLQIVMSLLNSQAASLHDPSALSAIRQSQHRVQAMALIHQKLYQTEGVARIPMETYIQEVVAYLHESYELTQPVHFELAIDPVELDVTQAVPLGLIINEAITNALKYAFPGGQAGKVQVRLRELEAGAYELLIADDGVGLPADFDPAQSRSLGMTLMYGFSEQLGGRLQISNQSGLSIRLLFQEEINMINS